jgi:hypothetical protein
MHFIVWKPCCQVPGRQLGGNSREQVFQRSDPQGFCGQLSPGRGFASFATLEEVDLTGRERSETRAFRNFWEKVSGS